MVNDSLPTLLLKLVYFRQISNVTFLLLDLVNLLEQLRLKGIEVLVEGEHHRISGDAATSTVDLVHPMKKHLDCLANGLGQGTAGRSLRQYNSLKCSKNCNENSTR